MLACIRLPGSHGLGPGSHQTCIRASDRVSPYCAAVAGCMQAEVYVPCGEHDHVGLDFRSIRETQPGLREPLNLCVVLHLDLAVDDPPAGTAI